MEPGRPGRLFTRISRTARTRVGIHLAGNGGQGLEGAPGAAKGLGAGFLCGSRTKRDSKADVHTARLLLFEKES